MIKRVVKIRLLAAEARCCQELPTRNKFLTAATELFCEFRPMRNPSERKYVLIVSVFVSFRFHIKAVLPIFVIVGGIVVVFNFSV